MSILKKILSSFLLVLFLSSSNYLKAQTDVALVELANEMYEFGDYEGALELYLQSIVLNKQNVQANIMAGRSYLRTTNAKHKSVPYFHEAFRLNPDVSNEIFFLIGEGYRFGYEFDKAMEHYERYLQMLETDSRCCPGQDIPHLIRRTKKRIEECKNAQQYVNAPGTAIITNLGDEINSEFDDYAPTFSADGKLLFFTSRRAGSTGGLKDVDHKFYEDIFVSRYEHGAWTTPENMGAPINSIYHESNIGLSSDAKNLYIYTIENNGDIYISEQKEGKWGKPKPFKHVNTEYQETTVYETPDGEMLFFSSNKPGGKGGLDIYYCKRNGLKWGEPTLLSDVINTEYDEEGAMFDIKNQILYFSSKGHNGMGGYDLYKSSYNAEKDTWSKPKNLGFPVNSSDDDLFFTLAPDGELGYYASFKDDSRGGIDIYEIKFIDELEQARIAEERRKKEVIVAFKIIDDATGEVINANISFLRTSSGKIVDELAFKGEELKKTFTSQMEGDYVVTIKAEGEKLDEYFIENMDLKIVSTTQVQEINKEIRLKRKVALTPPVVDNTLKDVVMTFNIVDDETGKEIKTNVSLLNSKTKKVEKLNSESHLLEKTFTPQMQGKYMLTFSQNDANLKGYVLENIPLDIVSTTQKQELVKEIRLKKKVVPVSNNLTTPKQNVQEFKAVTFDLKVVDAQNGKPLDAKVQILRKGQEKAFVEKNIKGGVFQHVFTDKAETHYVVIVSAGQHVFRTLELPILPSREQTKTVEKVVELRVPTSDPQKYNPQRLRNVYFDFDMHTLKPASYAELNKLEELLKENATMKIELAGHTDHIGSDAYNKNLSLMRAKAVKNYLVSKGIAADRIDVIGYGEEKPMASNDDEKEGRELNRRTEFIILRK